MDRRNSWVALVMPLLAAYYVELSILFRWPNQAERVIANMAVLAMFWIIADCLQWFV